jgi:hypothetical protein
VNAVSDPPVPKDGTCVVCGGQRRTEKVKLLYREAMRDDPFCSNVCARSWYGVPLPSTERTPRAYVSNMTDAG